MDKREKITIQTLRDMKAKGEPITMLTAYDYPMALAEEVSGIEIILVGDSLGMTVMGMDSTLPVTLDMIINHCKAVKRGAPTTFVIGDMPYMTYQISPEEAIRNAGRIMAEGGVDCVKLEGGKNAAKTVEAIVKATIPVMGHIGLTPQSQSQLGGFRAQGRDAVSAKAIIEDARALEEAGICALLIEAVPPEVTKIIWENASIPVISLGSGQYADGQLLIVHDMLGFFDRFIPKFVKKYADIHGAIVSALGEYVKDVKEKRFPEAKHCYPMKSGELEKLSTLLR